MKNSLKIAAVAAALALFGQANASIITIETGFSTAGSQASADDYKSVVDAAVAVPTAGYGSTQVANYDNITNHGLFGSSNYIAFKSTINFYVDSSNAGVWDLRSGVDFGMGGAAFLDGVALGFTSTDMWWNGSYANSSQYLGFTTALAAGNHTLSFYGVEHCCDGGQQAQFKAAGSNDFVTFSNYDGLIAPVPEPETYALMLLGVAAIGLSKRRKAA